MAAAFFLHFCGGDVEIRAVSLFDDQRPTTLGAVYRPGGRVNQVGHGALIGRFELYFG